MHSKYKSINLPLFQASNKYQIKMKVRKVKEISSKLKIIHNLRTNLLRL